MLVKRFLTWVQTAPAEARAAGTAALARALAGPGLGAADRADAIAALTLMADDADPLVRRALVDALADSPEAPAHLVLALGSDEPDIAAEIWRRSPVLEDGDLVDAVATRGPAVQEAIAARRPLGAPVAAAIAEVGEPQAAARLAANPDADIPAFSLARMAGRFAGHAAVTTALLARTDLPVVARYTLTAERLAATSAAGEPDRIRRDAQEKAALALAVDAGSDELADLARHLRGASHLTVSLLLRLVVCGGNPLFHASLAELSGMPLARVVAIASETKGGGFEALCRKAGLPGAAVPVFRAAHAAACGLRAEPSLRGGADATFPARSVLAHVAETVTRQGMNPDSGLAVALRRLAADIARDEALRAASELLRHDLLEAPPLLLERSMAVSQPEAMTLFRSEIRRELVQDNAMLALPAPQPAEAPTVREPSVSALAALLERTVEEALSRGLAETLEPADDEVVAHEEPTEVDGGEEPLAEVEPYAPSDPQREGEWKDIDAWWEATQHRLSSAA